MSGRSRLPRMRRSGSDPSKSSGTIIAATSRTVSAIHEGMLTAAGRPLNQSDSSSSAGGPCLSPDRSTSHNSSLCPHPEVVGLPDPMAAHTSSSPTISTSLGWKAPLQLALPCW